MRVCDVTVSAAAATAIDDNACRQLAQLQVCRVIIIVGYKVKCAVPYEQCRRGVRLPVVRSNCTSYCTPP